MSDYRNLKPIYRSKFRVFLGKAYYTYKRYFSWYSGKNKYAKTQIKDILKNQIFMHKTPLYRKLKDVDMWLQENKVENLKIALKHIDGMLIKPGETFSYWKCIGKPTVFKGYKKGMVLYYGKFKAGTGGGLCQLSNLLYWMMLHTPLTVTERHRHGFDVFPDSKRSQPFGSGATCVYNYRDLQIKNETNEVYQINLNIKDNFLLGEVKSSHEKYFTYKIYESEHKISHEYWGAYIRHNLIRREILNMNNKLIDDEYICENHALMMYEPLLTTSKESAL